MSKEVDAVISLRTRLIKKDIKDEFLEELLVIENALKRLAQYENETQSIGEMIAKKLKALEIMKRELPNLLFIRNTKDYDEFLEKAGDNLTEEEYDLLKEVLE